VRGFKKTFSYIHAEENDVFGKFAPSKLRLIIPRILLYFKGRDGELAKQQAAMSQISTNERKCSYGTD
jgi:hypothetical protein